MIVFIGAILLGSLAMVLLLWPFEDRPVSEKEREFMVMALERANSRR